MPSAAGYGYGWKCFKDQLKANLKKCMMGFTGVLWTSNGEPEQMTVLWRRMGFAKLEQRRITMEAEKRERRETHCNNVCAMCVVRYVDQ